MTSGPSRRAFLASGGAAVLVGGGAGVGIALTRPRPHPPAPPAPPAPLAEALNVEHVLLADIDATLQASPGLRAVLAGVRADHAAHAAALRGAIEATGAGVSEPVGELPMEVRSRRELRAAEQVASAGGVSRAAAAHGADAALLASIAACEATHAELLS